MLKLLTSKSLGITSSSTAYVLPCMTTALANTASSFNSTFETSATAHSGFLSLPQSAANSRQSEERYIPIQDHLRNDAMLQNTCAAHHSSQAEQQLPPKDAHAAPETTLQHLLAERRHPILSMHSARNSALTRLKNSDTYHHTNNATSLVS